MSRIYPICSSSKGNSTFIGTRGHGILVDAGCSLRALNAALELIDTKLSGIEAIFITHEHIDHIKGLEQIVKHTKIPIFATVKTAEALKTAAKIPQDTPVYDSRIGYQSAAFDVTCFKTSHDSADSVGYKVRFGTETFGVCTDTGMITAETAKALRGVRTILLESNHDVETLRRNPNYHADLKRRILGDYGHLSNDACAEFAEKLIRGGTRNLILGHLSQENNSPDTAAGCTRRFLESKGLFEEYNYTLFVAPVTSSGEFIAV